MIALIIIPICLAIGLLLGGLYAYVQAFFSKGSKKNVNKYFEQNESFQNAKDNMKRMQEDVLSCPFEEIYIKSFDGTKLFGRYYHINDGAPLQILIHGYKGSAIRDMCGAHMLARQLGHNILLVDQRGIGKSKGRTITFGVKERRDALEWIKHMSLKLNNPPIFVIGVSMGGAVSLMITDMDLPSNVVGTIADCPYSSPKAIIKKVCIDRGMPEHIYPIVTIGALAYGHFNPNKEGAIKSVKASKIPILILHGEKDSFVPCSMAREIYEAANCEKRLYTFENADHGTSYMTDPEKYEHAVREFVEFCLKNRHRVD